MSLYASGCNYFIPIHLQKSYVEQFGYQPGDFPICESIAARTIALPFHAGLTESDVNTVCSELAALL
ncbi:MAG TPA: DegT/DnrJ/EryC1/StrS family aminotransferase [Phycisphaerae bacterium]